MLKMVDKIIESKIVDEKTGEVAHMNKSQINNLINSFNTNIDRYSLGL